MKRTAYQPSNVFVPAGKSYSHGIMRTRNNSTQISLTSFFAAGHCWAHSVNSGIRRNSLIPALKPNCSN